MCARGVIIPDYYHLYEQSVLKFADWFAVAWATDEEKEMIFAVKLPAHNNLANCSFRLGTQPSAEPYPGPVHDAGCSAPCTMHHAPCTMHHAPCTMHHAMRRRQLSARRGAQHLRARAPA